MEDRSFYVYAHYRLDTMEPFYIGKGRGNRKDILSRNTIHDRISKKHGHAVVILYDNLTEQEAFFYEREVIEDLVFNEGYEIPCKNCGEFTRKFSYLTNFSFGGEGVSGCNYSEESKKKISLAIKKHYEDEKEREKLSKAIKISWENPERKKIQSKIQRKRFEDPKVRKKQSKAQRKRFEDPKEREKIRKIQIKRFKDPKEREKLSKVQRKRFEDPKEREKNSRPGEKNGNAKNVYCKELNILFSYIKLAEKYCINILNIKIGPIRDVCNGKRIFTGKLADGTKLTWEWKEDVDQEILDKAEYIDSKKYEEILSQNVNVCK